MRPTDCVAFLLWLLPTSSSGVATFSARKLEQMRTISLKKIGPALAAEYLILDASADSLVGKGGRSEILACVRGSDVEEGGGGRPLTLKVVKEEARYGREKKNYETVCGRSRLANFVCVERFEAVKAGTNVIIMERGAVDLKRASTLVGPVRGPAFKRTAAAMAAAVQRVHGKGLVWTDIKLDNFVLVDTAAPGSASPIKPSPPPPQQYLSNRYMCKAIDLESAVRAGAPLVDFSPEGLAPEQLGAIASGGAALTAVGNRRNDLSLTTSQPLLAATATDVWALGVALLHLYLGKAPLTDRPGDVRAAIDTVQRYVDGDTDLGLSQVAEPGARRLLQSMLAVDPRQRPGSFAVAAAITLFV